MELRDLLTRLKKMGGSDLHIAAGLPPAVRVFDELVGLNDAGRPTPEQVRDLLYPILAKQEIERFENDPDARYELDFARGVADLGRFRFNLYKQRGSLAATIRALSDSIPALESLGLPPVVEDLTRSRRGVILVTGPAGSGRSTSLASIINAINHQWAARITTIEDPVEYVIPSDQAFVTQREIGDGADTLSFENALRRARRQDLDVIMVGNIAGFETMRLVLDAAEMGLLVLGCMSTVSATETVARYIERFPPEMQSQAVSQLSANLVAVVSQLLLPRTDRRGRVLACEVMRTNELIRSGIRQGRLDSLYGIIQSGGAEGMQSMDQSLVELARQRLVDYATVKPHIREEATHRMIYQLAGTGRAGTPLPPSAERAAEKRAKAVSTPPDAVNLYTRRRRGNIVIPPWEKKA